MTPGKASAILRTWSSSSPSISSVYTSQSVDTAVSDDEVDVGRRVAGTAGLSVQVRDDQDSLAAVRTAATLIGVRLALAIVAMAISLLRGESAQDVRTLSATGATARTRRTITATTAGTFATLGVMLSLEARTRPSPLRTTTTSRG